jgi:hypothetical protein
MADFLKNEINNCVVKENVRNAGLHLCYAVISKERNGIQASYAVPLSTACKVLINYKLHVNRPTASPPPLTTYQDLI